MEKTEKFQKILKENKLNDFQQITKNDLKELVNQVTEIVIKESYKYNEEELSEENKLHAKNLAHFSLKGKLDNNSFQKALNLIKEDKLKKEDYMPDINFDIEVKGKKYNFSKLPADDMRGFMLGKFSNSCQSIGHDSERCVLDGMSKANAGFYIITDYKGNIRAQSYAWFAGEGKKNEKATSMVLDSFEHLGKEDKLLFVPIINKLREALQKQALNLYVGCGNS
nr:hypothetical protein [Rickettsia rhipicephali]